MSKNDLTEQINRINDEVDRGRLYAAMDLADSCIASYALFAPLREQAARLRETYGFVVAYALSGTPDPSRQSMIDATAAGLRTLAARMLRIEKSVDTPSLYFSVVRFEATRPDGSPAAFARELLEKASRLSMAAFADPEGTSPEFAGLRRENEEAASRWFRLVWTAFPLTDADATAITSVISADVAPASLKALTAGALMLGSIDWFDLRRLSLLLDLAADSDRATAMRATLGFAVAAAMAPDRKLLEPLKARLDALAENPTWRDDLSAIFRQLLHTRDTERITRKMTDEILPSLQKLGSELKRNTPDPADPESMEFTEEWAELIENSGIGDKVREMNEIQEQGGDVLMTTFGHLKNFPFFNDIANWFAPFDWSRSEIAGAAREFGPFAEMLTSAPMLCDNDRWSAALALAGMPKAQRDMMAAQIEAQQQQLAEMQHAALNAEARSRDALAADVVRSLYRFFRLYNRREEFTDPFATALNLLGVDILAAALDHDSLLAEAAGFYFTHGYYAEALPLLRQLESVMKSGSEADVYYRKGYSLAMLGDYAGALEAYERSELFGVDTENLDLQMAIALRKTGNHRRAAELFRKVSARRGGDDKTDLFTAASLAATGAWAEAAAIFYRVDYSRGLSNPFLRDLAMCEFMMGNNDKCRIVVGRLTRMTPRDYALLAAVEIASGNYPTAVAMLAAPRAGTDRMARELREILSENPSVAVDSAVIDLIIDSSYQKEKENGK